jgi:hypothetical protein
MSWNPADQRAVATALLGSWPDTIARWGQEAFAAYLSELEARGLYAADALLAIRAWPPGSDFPPSAPNLAGVALRDPTWPDWTDAFAQIWGTGRDRRDRHPVVAAFIKRYGEQRLELLEIYDPDYGAIRQREVQEAFERFAARHEQDSRATLAAIASQERERGLRPPGFLSAIPEPESPPDDRQD